MGCLGEPGGVGWEADIGYVVFEGCVLRGLVDDKAFLSVDGLDGFC